MPVRLNTAVRVVDNAEAVVRDIREKQMGPAIAALAAVAEDDLRATAPVDSGDLRDSFGHVLGKKKPMTAYATGLWYWRFVNDGTIKMPADPFVRRAQEQTDARMEEIIARRRI